MIQVPIQSVPNQELTFQNGDNIYVINIITTKDSTVVSISLNNIPVISGLITIPYGKLMPYSYGSNFIFTTQNNDLVDYTKFNDTQELFFLELGIDL
jgi:hypothetical protein